VKSLGTSDFFFIIGSNYWLGYSNIGIKSKLTVNNIILCWPSTVEGKIINIDFFFTHTHECDLANIRFDPYRHIISYLYAYNIIRMSILIIIVCLSVYGCGVLEYKKLSANLL